MTIEASRDTDKTSIFIAIEQEQVEVDVQREEMEARVRGGRGGRVSNADRQRLIKAHESNEDVVQLARQMGINTDTARSIIRVWMTEGRMNALPCGGQRMQSVKMDADMVQTMLEIVQQQPFTTLENINEELRRRRPEKPQVCAKTIARHLDNQLVTLKIAGKDADVPFRRNTTETKLRRQQYAQWLTGLNVNHKLIYIDETGFNVYQRRSQGRAPVGERVRRNNGVRGRNINVIVAISADFGVIRYSTSQETLNHDRYQDFINELVRTAAPMFAEQDQVHIIHDGARPHLHTIVEAEFAAQFDVQTLPPYSPFLNPVEQAHSCFKAAVGRQLVLPATQEELTDVGNQRQAEGLNLEQWRARILLRLTNEAMTEVTPVKCLNWCNRVHRFIPPSLAGVDIFG